jgi:cell division protein FtsB
MRAKRASARASQGSRSRGLTTNNVATKNVAAKRRTGINTTVQKRKIATESMVKPRKTTVKRKVNRQLDVPMMKPKEMTLKKPRVNVKTNTKPNIANLAYVIMVFAIFFMICYRYSTINENFQGIQKLKSDIEVSKALNGQLEAEIASKTDLSYIENYAKYQLGMQKPSNGQIKQITLEKEDKITTPVNIEEEKDDGVITYILKEIRKILD